MCDHHYSGPLITQKLGATYPPTPGAPSTLAYLVLLRVEIARFTFGPVAQLALRRGTKLVSVALILTLCCPLAGAVFSGQPLAATLPYAVRTFLQCLVSQIAPAVVWRASRAGLSALAYLYNEQAAQTAPK